MRLSSFTDYGLRALMLMAGDPLRGFSTAELADHLGLSRHHLSKIVQCLARGGVLATRRGGGGGVTLARPAAQIGLGSVIRLLEDGHALVECFAPPAAGGAGCNLLPACRLRARLRSAEEAFLTDLDRSSLAEIAVTSLPLPPVAA